MHAFPEFWEMFAVAVHDNPTVPTISKFLYLKGKLKGEAYKLISPLQFSECNYQQAVQLLKKTYMRPDILRIQLVHELQAVPPAHDIPTSQRTTLCTLKALWVQLEKLGEHPASTAHKCTIGEKFPLRTMEKAGELKNAGEDWTVNHLLDALDQRKYGARQNTVTTQSGVEATHQRGQTHPRGVAARSAFVEDTSQISAEKFQRSTPGGKSSETVGSAGNVYSLNTVAPGATHQLACSAPAVITAHCVTREKDHEVQLIGTPRDGIVSQDRTHPVDDRPAQSLAIQTADGHVHPAGPPGPPPLVEAVLLNAGTLPTRESGSETHLLVQIQFNLIITPRHPWRQATRAIASSSSLRNQGRRLESTLRSLQMRPRKRSHSGRDHLAVSLDS
ncbi:unnamed protein product [Heligmosomoides polygyrus]|uniref:Vps16_C domain-containing protein n=1 Tax=Heligmosomoides polygyrus TaxID=6339 RepID=A0A183F936_HELPZ|nr:unnamed protein product [Heligmosomoides polygyrus]